MNENDVRLLIAESLERISPQHTGKVSNKHVWREIADLRQLAEPRSPECCECSGPAEFEIFDHNERRPDCGSTLACEKHVGSLLGSVPPTKPTGPWTVVALDGPATPKVEPKPKFEVGQWVEHEWGTRGRVVDLMDGTRLEIRLPESSHLASNTVGFKPCSPVCTVEQLSILPGDKVQMDEILVGEDGKPLPQNLQCSGREGTVVNVDGRFSLYLDLGYRTGPPCSRKVYRWNLHIIECGPSGPGGQR